MMKTIIHILLSVVIFFPMLIFIATYYICKRRQLSAVRAFGIASDQTTIWLFFSVPLAISGLWGVDVGSVVIMISIVIAMLFTFIEWRTKKEIEIKPLLRKVWRVFFLMLTTSYIAIWVFGLIQSIVQYVGAA